MNITNIIQKWRKLLMRYSNLLDLVRDFIEGDTSLSSDEIKDKAYEAYENGNIDSSQYDHILNTLDEF